MVPPFCPFLASQQHVYFPFAGPTSVFGALPLFLRQNETAEIHFPDGHKAPRCPTAWFLFSLDPYQFLVGFACFQGSQCFRLCFLPLIGPFSRELPFGGIRVCLQGTPNWASVFLLGFRLQNEKGTFAAFASTKGQALVVSSNSSAPPKKLAALLFVCCLRVVCFLFLFCFLSSPQNPRYHYSRQPAIAPLV